MFAWFFEDFYNLLEPSLRAGGSVTAWTLWSSIKL